MTSYLSHGTLLFVFNFVLLVIAVALQTG